MQAVFDIAKNSDDPALKELVSQLAGTLSRLLCVWHLECIAWQTRMKSEPLTLTDENLIRETRGALKLARRCLQLAREEEQRQSRTFVAKLWRFVTQASQASKLDEATTTIARLQTRVASDTFPDLRSDDLTTLLDAIKKYEAQLEVIIYGREITSAV